MTRWAFLLLGASCLAAACNRSDSRSAQNDGAGANITNGLEDGAATAAEANETNSATQVEDCPKLDIEWHAEVGAQDGQRMLNVTGNGMVNSGGWKFSLRPGLLDRMNPPVQRFTLTIQQPSGPSTQPMVPFRVEAETPAQPRYEAVAIDCGGAEYARITQIDRP